MNPLTTEPGVLIQNPWDIIMIIIIMLYTTALYILYMAVDINTGHMFAGEDSSVMHLALGQEGESLEISDPHFWCHQDDLMYFFRLYITSSSP